MKRFCIFLLTLALLIPHAALPSAVSADADGKSIDVYFIAGQSNAAGCSFCATVTDQKGAYLDGYSNVLYLGCALNNHSETGVIVSTPTPVQFGTGMSASHFGAEVGMAEYLSQYYNANSGKTAVIIKYGVNSSSLDGTYAAHWGSWLAPSLLDEGYSIFDGGVNFYDKLQDTLDDSIAALQAAGYTELNYKGFYWSQGESESTDATRAERYATLLSALITDFRGDLYARTKNPQDLKLPFLISEICPSFNQNTMLPDGTSSSPSINTVVALQRQVAADMENVSTLDTTVYTIKNGEFGCRDVWHYGGDAMIDIGNRVGASLYGRGVIASITDGAITPGGCSVKVQGNRDDSVTVSWKLPQSYTVEAILLNGADIANTVAGSRVTISKELADQTAQLVVLLRRVSSRMYVSVLQSKLTLVLENADGSATVYDPNSPAAFVYEDGSVVRFKLFAERAGYYPACVKCNGEELKKDADGFYSFRIEGDSYLEIRHTRVQTLSVDLGIMLFNPNNPLGK